MYIKRSLIFCLSVLLFLILCDSKTFAGGNQLDREKAKDILIKHYGWPCDSHTDIIIAKSQMSTTTPWMLNVMDIAKMENDKLIFRGQNYSDVKINENLMKYVNKMYDDTISIPLLGRADVRIFQVKLYHQRFIEITGIKFINNNQAVVKYTFENYNPTPFAKYIKSEPNILGKYAYPLGKVEEENTLDLYDDGWRIEVTQ